MSRMVREVIHGQDRHTHWGISPVTSVVRSIPMSLSSSIIRGAQLTIDNPRRRLPTCVWPTAALERIARRPDRPPSRRWRSADPAAPAALRRAAARRAGRASLASFRTPSALGAAAAARRPRRRGRPRIGGSIITTGGGMTSSSSRAGSAAATDAWSVGSSAGATTLDGDHEDGSLPSTSLRSTFG